MRQNIHARINPTRPEAHAICDRCGQRWNLVDLRWQYDWRGPRLQNLRILVCPPCVDNAQMNGQRTYILPQDPVPVFNARPEFYVPDDAPLSAVGASPVPLSYIYGQQIGNMVNYGSVPAAFDGNQVKSLAVSAVITVSNSSFNNYVGINWTKNTLSLNAPSSLNYQIIQHSVVSYTLTAPVDAAFGSTAFVIQGGAADPAAFSAWTTIASGTPANTVGEIISGQTTGGLYQFHRAAFYGTGQQIAVAQVQLSVGQTGNTGGL